MPTYSTKPSDVTRAWHEVDADGLVLGRLSTEVARLLRGKHKAIFAPHLDTGDHVIIVNAAKVVMTSDKAACRPAPSPLSSPGRSWRRARRAAPRPHERFRPEERDACPPTPPSRAT